MSDMLYSETLPDKSPKKIFLAIPIRGYLTEDDTTLDNFSLFRRRKRNSHAMKEKHANDELISSERN